MYKHNYKNLPYKISIRKFLKDYFFRYYLFGQFTHWKTKNNKKIMICKLNKKHIENIVNIFGNTQTRNNYPYIWFRYIKECEI